MVYFVRTKDGVSHRTENIHQAYYYFGWEVGRFEAKNDLRLEISDWPEEFYENTFCIAFPQWKEPIQHAIIWITGRE